MTLGALRVSALALSAAALVLASPLPAANARRLVAHSTHISMPLTHVSLLACHARLARVRRARPRRPIAITFGETDTATLNGYNPGAAVAAGVIGGSLAAGYPYSCDYSYCGPYGYGYATATTTAVWRLRAVLRRLWLWLWPRLQRSPFWLRPRLPRKWRSVRERKLRPRLWRRPLRRRSAAAIPAALAVVTLAALAAATWAGLAAAISAAAGTSANIRFASPSASGGLRAARFFGQTAGSKATPS